MNASLLRPLIASLALASTLSAQTWIGGTSLNWDDTSNWDPATVPDGATNTAVFTSAGLGSEATRTSMGGSHTLAGIRFASGTQLFTVYVSDAGGPASLTLAGSGLENNSEARKFLWLTSPTFGATSRIDLEFRNQATVTGDVRLIAIGSDRFISFRDHSSAGSASFGAYTVDFYDDASAGASIFDQTFGAVVAFHDRSTAGTAKLPGTYGNVIFADSSTAGNASIQRPQQSYGSSALVSFRDHATAGNAVILLNGIEFAGNSSADHATISNHGLQYYSSHGAYATYQANATFRDAATAAHATISNNSLGVLTWTDNSTADHATITNTGSVRWSGHSSFGDARLLAGSGSYYGYGGYNQPAPSIPTGGVYFMDQAQGGLGTIEITSAGAWLDFGGLVSGTGTTGRTFLPTGQPADAVTPDDRVTFSVGSITNTAPGGRIYLGGTDLTLGANNRDMTLSAQISDVGGSFRSSAGAALAGGGIYKVGTGMLTLTNPNNDFTGTVGVFNGTLNLAGAAIPGTVVADTGRLTGNGIVRGHLANGAGGNGALVSPGNSAGTITVTGNYVQYAGGSLNLEIASANSHDQLVVQGKASLDGRLSVAFIDGYVPVGSATVPLLVANEVNGQFATITGPANPGAALAATVATGPAGVSLNITQLPFSGFAGSAAPASAALAAHLDANLAASTGDFRALITRLNTLPDAAALAGALETLSPDRYAVLAPNGILGAAEQQAARDRQFATWRAGARRGLDVFFEAGQRRATFDAEPGVPAASSSLDSGTAGGAWHNDNCALGASIAQESGHLDLDATGSRAGLKSVVPAVFFQYQRDRWFVDAAAAFSRDDYDLRRRVAFSGFDRMATAVTSGTRHDFTANVGTTLRAATWSFTPQAGVLISRWHLDGFTETGAAGADLRLPDQSVRSLRTRLGVTATGAGERFSPQLSVFWLHETGDDATLPAAFASAAGSPYTAPGRAADPDVVRASVGFDYQLGKRAIFTASVAAAWGRNSAVTSNLTAGFRWKF